MTSRHKLAFTIGAATLLAVTACGSGGSSSASSSGNGKPTLTITSPADGASVAAPVKLTFTTSEPIGPTDSGKDHVHVVVDGNTSKYTVVTSTQTEIANLSPGRHTIGVTLQHADHSPAGASAEVAVTVTGGSTATPSSSGSSSGYGY